MTATTFGSPVDSKTHNVTCTKCKDPVKAGMKCGKCGQVAPKQDQVVKGADLVNKPAGKKT